MIAASFSSMDGPRAARPERGPWSQWLIALCKKVSACNTSNPGSETGHTGSQEGQRSCCDARQKLFLLFPDSSHSSEIHRPQFNWQETTTTDFFFSPLCNASIKPSTWKDFACIIHYKGLGESTQAADFNRSQQMQFLEKQMYCWCTFYYVLSKLLVTCLFTSKLTPLGRKK